MVPAWQVHSHVPGIFVLKNKNLRVMHFHSKKNDTKEETGMSKKNRVAELIIDPEFESYVPPLTQEEFDLLEENILCMRRVTDPIIGTVCQRIGYDG